MTQGGAKPTLTPSMAQTVMSASGNDDNGGETKALSSADVERIAARVAEFLKGGKAVEEKWVTAEVIAKRFGVSRSWVYNNADKLGALRIGQGKNVRVRFDSQLVGQRLQAVGAPPSQTPVSRRARQKRRARSGAGDLLPIRQRPRAP